LISWILLDIAQHSQSDLIRQTKHMFNGRTSIAAVKLRLHAYNAMKASQKRSDSPELIIKQTYGKNAENPCKMAVSHNPTALQSSVDKIHVTSSTTNRET
jgi:hypothetical protein